MKMSSLAAQAATPSLAARSSRLTDVSSWNEINYNTGSFAGIVVTFTASEGRHGVGTVLRRTVPGK